MSIDALIQAHTEALLANTEAVKLLTLSLAGRTPVKEDKPATKVKTIEQAKDIAETIKENLEAAGVIKTVELKQELPVTIEGEPLPYETARALVLKLAGAGKRAEIPQVFKAHGIDNLKKLLDKEDDFTTVNDQAKLEAVYADLQALEA